MGLIAILFFGGGLGASWYLAKQKLAAEQQALAEANDPNGVLKKVPTDPEAAQQHAKTGEHGTEHEEEMPIAVRPEVALSQEEIYKYGEMFNKQRERIAKDQEAVDLERKRVEHVLKEITASQREMDGLQVQLEQGVKKAQSLLEALNERMQTLDAQKKEVEALIKQKQAMDNPPPGASSSEEASPTANRPGGEPGRDIAKLAEVMQGMNKTQAAEMITTLSNQGRLAEAAEVLQKMEPRNASKILANLDAELRIQISDLFSKPSPK